MTRSFLDAAGLFTVCPVPRRGRPARGVVLWLPLIGLLLAGAAFVPALAVWRGGSAGSALLAAVLVVACHALLTRGLHVDGLADLADGLGSRRPAPQAQVIMREPALGAFGVAAIGLDLLVQVAALAVVFEGLSRLGALVATAVVLVTGRLAVLAGCRRGVPAAPGSTLGVLVAGSVSWAAATVGTVLGIAAATLAMRWAGAPPGMVVAAGAAVFGGVAIGQLLLRHAVCRLGGVSGDVFGAISETASVAAVLVLAIGATWR